MKHVEKNWQDAGKLRQFLAAVVVNFSALSYGIMIGWQSPVTPQLQSSNPPVGTEPMTDEEASWLSGSMCLGGIMMTLCVGVIVEKLGRKLSGCLLALPYCICWLLMIFAADHMYLFVARFLTGIGGAGSLFLIPLYVSEISCDSIRGMLGSLMIFVLNIGILLSYILGAFLSFRVFAIVGSLPVLIYLVTFFFLPETPVYLVRMNRLHDAAKSLLWLKGGNKIAAEHELSHLQAQLKEASGSKKSVGLSDLFRDKATKKGLIISMGLFSGQQFGGIFAVMSYTETIFRISGSSLSPETATIVVGAIQVFGSYLSTSLMERMGRRYLILISALGMCICHVALATFCHLQILEYEVSAFNWVPVVALSTFVIVYSLGMGAGPYVVSSEIFSRDISGLATTLGLLMVWIVAFIVIKFFASFIALLGMHGCFYLLGFFCACTFVFTFFLLPETKGRPREEILDELNGVSYVLQEKHYDTTDETLDKESPLSEPV